jgi:hypothetical protein
MTGFDLVNITAALLAVVGACRARRATLIIARLDRLAGDTAFLLSIVRGEDRD